MIDRSRCGRGTWVIALIGLAGAMTAQAADELSNSSALVRLKNDIAFLAADEQEGRGPGTDGIERAADYIAAEFAEAGLKPAEGAEGYFQEFTIKGNPKLGETQTLTFQVGEGEPISGELRADFMPLSVGFSGEFEQTPMVFAGYGITTNGEDGEPAFDDYAGLDVEGKVVLILRSAPGANVEGSPFAGKDGQPSRYATFEHKLTNAFAHKAKGVLLVNNGAEVEGREDELLPFLGAGTERLTQIPVVMMKRSFVDKVLNAAGVESLEAMEKAILGEDGKTPKPSSRELAKIEVDGEIEIGQELITTKNVVGVLDGEGPLADETIVVGAHYDHLGFGGRNSLAPFSNAIHNGADDNASGTAMILELARRLAARPEPLPRRVVFIAFSGEERGLLGSRHYVNEEPLYPVESTVAMFNFDMVGRLNDKNQLTVFGVDSTPGLREMVTALGPEHDLEIRPNAEIAGNSDHASFHAKNMPIVFFFTGTHKDYHRPSDDTEYVNLEGMGRIANLAETVLLDFVARSERPAFVAAPPADSRPVRGFKVSLGIIPDYDETIIGLRINGARPGSPADKAGMKEGDVITSIAERPVGTIYDYMDALGSANPGDVVAIKVLRDGKELELKAKLEAPAAAHTNK